jgi:hypothetical protein
MLDGGRVLPSWPPLPLRRGEVHAQAGAAADPRFRRRGAGRSGQARCSPRRWVAQRRSSLPSRLPRGARRVRQESRRGRHCPQPAGLSYCSENPARDWEILKEHALYQLQHYPTWFKAAGQPLFGDPPADFADLESRGVYLCGTPDEIVTAITADHELARFTRHNFWATRPRVDPAMGDAQHRAFRPGGHSEAASPLSDPALKQECEAQRHRRPASRLDRHRPGRNPLPPLLPAEGVLRAGARECLRIQRHAPGRSQARSGARSSGTATCDRSTRMAGARSESTHDDRSSRRRSPGSREADLARCPGNGRLGRVGGDDLGAHPISWCRVSSSKTMSGTPSGPTRSDASQSPSNSSFCIRPKASNLRR